MEKLNLSKGQTLDLNKHSGKILSKLRVGAGWDPSEDKGDFDLDLWLVPKGSEPCYFNNMTIPGAKLDKDDRSGSSSDGGADENIHIDVSGLEKDEYTIIVNIYDAVSRGQYFRDVKNIFVEIEDEEAKAVLSSYEVKENGGDNIVLVFGSLKKNAEGGYEFTAIGEFSAESTEKVVEKYN